MEHGHLFQGATALNDRARARRIEGAAAHRDETDSRWRHALRGVVESEILPRLRKAHPSGEASSIAATPEDIEAFGRLLLAKDVAEALALVAALREKTSPADPGLLDMLTRTARHFGDMWNADLCDFVDVTIGLRRLHLILNDLSADLEAKVAVAPDAPRVLLLPAPGESHGFGIAMVQFSFRAAGWCAECGFAADYLVRLRDEWYDLVGLSVSCDDRLATLRSSVDTARRTSRNPAIIVMAGGPSLAGRPEFALSAGADGSADDAVGAVFAAQSLLDRRTTV
jgi:methanogenic corrinoid protein MtbC1